MRKRTAVWAFVVGAALGASFLSGCAVDKDEIKSWYTVDKHGCIPERGPIKLRQVIVHDKFAWDLRIEAVMGLVLTRPDAGRWVGMKVLMEGENEFRQGALDELQPATRERLLTQGQGGTQSVVEQLILGMKQEWDGKNNDPTVPYKDAAYAILSKHFVSDEKSRDALANALVDWLKTNTEARLFGNREAYPVQKLLDLLKEYFTAKERAENKCSEKLSPPCDNPALAVIPDLHHPQVRERTQARRARRRG